MDKFYLGKDKRPKRRKYADFPYTIFTVEAENAEPQFYVRFVDGEGKNHCIALGMELYRAMNQLELDVKRLHNEEERHFARGVQFPEAICASGDQVADWVEGKLMQEALHKAITILPDTQRRRLELYYFAGIIKRQSFETFQTYLVVCVIYFILTFTVTRLLRWVERKLDGNDSYVIFGSQSDSAAEIRISREA